MMSAHHQMSHNNTDATGTSIKSNYQALFLEEDKQHSFLFILPAQTALKDNKLTGDRKCRHRTQNKNQHILVGFDEMWLYVLCVCCCPCKTTSR